MNAVFEDFVVGALREALGLSPDVLVQGGGGRSLRLDEAGTVALEPDLSWWDGAVCTFVGDVKYKRVQASGINHPDLYQLLAYTIATGLPGGLLVYAAGEGSPTTHTVRHVGKHIEVVTLDLADAPHAVLERIAEVAARIRRLRDKACAATEEVHTHDGHRFADSSARAGDAAAVTDGRGP